MNKRNIWIVLLVLVCTLVFSSCAPTETGTTNTTETSKPSVTQNSHITVQHIITGISEYYVFDYVEDRQNGYGCYVYDGSESGSIFCFKLDQ